MGDFVWFNIFPIVGVIKYFKLKLIYFKNKEIKLYTMKKYTRYIIIML